MKALFLILIVLFSLTLLGCSTDQRTILIQNTEDIQVAQIHRVATFTPTAINTWLNVTWDLEIINETFGTGYELVNTNQSIQVDFNGIIRIQGCIHPYNNGIGTQEATIYTRILRNDVEARCLQTSQTKGFKEDGVDTFQYIGTVDVNKGDNITLQIYTTNIDLILEGSPIFDNPTSASINFEKISNLRE